MCLRLLEFFSAYLTDFFASFITYYIWCEFRFKSIYPFNLYKPVNIQRHHHCHGSNVHYSIRISLLSVFCNVWNSCELIFRVLSLFSFLFAFPFNFKVIISFKLRYKHLSSYTRTTYTTFNVQCTLKTIPYYAEHAIQNCYFANHSDGSIGIFVLFGALQPSELFYSNAWLMYHVLCSYIKWNYPNIQHESNNCALQHSASTSSKLSQRQCKQQWMHLKYITNDFLIFSTTITERIVIHFAFNPTKIKETRA